MVNGPTSVPIELTVAARTRPPAKLNLFLEVIARRDDGFHEIDTVMVPIDWCDQLTIRRRRRPGIDLDVAWTPSRQAIATELAIEPHDPLLDVPTDAGNLVHRALTEFVAEFEIAGGFDCRLEKSIPVGAGLGGASSDAASALRLAASLTGIDLSDPRLGSIAANIGSDVPFFLGDLDRGDPTISAARATGRGEKLQPVMIGNSLSVLVVYPAVALPTALVYANCQVPNCPQTADQMVNLLSRGEWSEIESLLMNRLTEPAKKLAPQVDEILKSMWRAGLRTCQLTGSGSACFAIIDSANSVVQAEQQVRTFLIGSCLLSNQAERSKQVDPGSHESGARRLGARIKAARSVQVPAAVEFVRGAPIGA